MVASPHSEFVVKQPAPACRRRDITGPMDPSHQPSTWPLSLLWCWELPQSHSCFKGHLDNFLCEKGQVIALLETSTCLQRTENFLSMWLPQCLYRDLFLPLCGVQVSVFKKASGSLSVLSPAGGGGSAGHCCPGEGCVFD